MVDFPAYFSDNLGKLIFLGGAVFLAVSVLSFSMTGGFLSAAALFLGILMVVFGLFLQLDLLSDSLRSLSGAGMLSICVAIVFFAFGLAALEFVEVYPEGLVGVPWRGVIIGYKALWHWERPYEWISALCLDLGLGFLVFGVGMRIAGRLRQ